MPKIQNIYYMMAYAFRALNKDGFSKVETEPFDNALNLYASILSIGVNQQIKSGLNRDYKSIQEITSAPKGRLHLSESIKQNTFIDKKVSCIHDEYTENTLLNQIIKSVMIRLLRSKEVSNKYKRDLKKILPFFQDIDTIDIKHIDWNRITYYKNNLVYKMLINVCYLATKGLIQSEQKGPTSLLKFVDDQDYHKLFERFVLNYYKKHFRDYHPRAPHIDWNIDDEQDDLLPNMKTDTMLEKDGKKLIIDTKLYQKTLQEYHGHLSQHSSNLYQIFTYVKNADAHHTGNVSGVLLYAHSDQTIAPDRNYSMDGNKIMVKSIDLNADFTVISDELDSLVQFVK